MTVDGTAHTMAPISLRILALVVVSAAVGAACEDARARSTTPAAAVATPAAARPPSGWHPCDAGLECAQVDVPRRHGDAGSPAMRLDVVRRRATVAPARGTIIGLLGGPGVASADVAIGGFRLPAPLEKHYDFVTWNPRGTGADNPFSCGGVERDYQRSGAGAVTGADGPSANTVATTCANALAAVELDLSSTAAAHDLELIRTRLLDAKPVSLLGVSYGAVLAVHYASAFPSSVAKIVLDGVVDPYSAPETFLGAQARAMTARLRTWETRHRVDDALTELEAAAVLSGIPAGRSERLHAGDLHAATLDALAHEANEGAYWRQLELARAGDASALFQTARRFSLSYSYATYLATMCSDWSWPRTPEEFVAVPRDASAGSTLAMRALVADVAPCAYWPEVTPAATTLDTHLAQPTLVILETHDVVTPPDLARQLTTHFTEIARFEVPIAEHTAVTSHNCAARRAAQFLAGQAETAVCHG